MKITGNTLKAWGWTSGPHLGQALERAQALAAEGLNEDAIRSQLEPDRLLVGRLLKQRPADPERLGIAMVAASPDEQKNMETVRQQMLGMTTIPVVERAAILPDACPTGGNAIAITVGGAVSVRDAIIPAAHSADVCCSMYCSLFPAPALNTTQLLDLLQRCTRFGIGGRAPEEQLHHAVLEEKVWRNPFLMQLESAAKAHLADQGDGNHFAYLGELRMSSHERQRLEASGFGDWVKTLDPESRYLALVTHHGSRALGAQVYKRGLRAAIAHTKRVATGIPNEAAWLDMKEEEGQQYWEALQYVARWTRANHELIHQGFLDRLGLQGATLAFGNEHNFVWQRKDGLYYHGKGATPAWTGTDGRPLPGLIPLNMGSPILLCLGAGNEDYLGFAPHGAGRNLSRTALLKRYCDDKGRLDPFRVQEAIREATDGIEVRWWYEKPDLSETPLGYKDADAIIRQIEHFGLARICGRIDPLGCIMAGDGGTAAWKQRKKELTPKQLRQQSHRADRRTQKQRRWDDRE
jgi:tRNA-splicing ligase RtcB (3'-phosphate/5'-hydroxy nucleic acid ligase)